MPLSSALAPGFIRLTVQTNNHLHHQIIPVNFDNPNPSPGVSPELLTTDETAIDFLTAINAWAVVLAAQITSDDKIGLADVYKVDATSGERTFLYATDVAMVGTNTGATVPFVQAVWTFKCTSGKPLKVYVMESVYDADVRNVGSVPADARGDVLDYILAPSGNIFYGRSNAYPISFIAFTTKENDILRRNGALQNI